MNKCLSFGMFLSFFLVSLTSCHKEEPNSNDNNQVLQNAVTDIDGNSYDAIQIGNQVWMTDNLRTTRYADGSTIPLGDSNSYTEPYRYAPGLNQSSEENMSNAAQYSYLYNWSAVMNVASSSTSNPSGVQGICPDGWHVPSDAEWTELTTYVKSQPNYLSSGSAEHIAKALAATWGWNSSNMTDVPGNNPSTNNSTGFSAPPAGYWDDGTHNFGGKAYFWSATEGYNQDAYGLEIHNDYEIVQRYNDYKYVGLSVRCIRN